MLKTDFDAIIIGSGPNGLAAAIALQQKGLSVLIVEAKATIGGGLRTAELTLTGFKHDICSAIHPLAIASPFFNSLPLEKHGLTFIHAKIAAAHPLDDGTAAILTNSLQETANNLGVDKDNYLNLIEPITKQWEVLLPELLAPLHFPKDPIGFAKFGLKAFE